MGLSINNLCIGNVLLRINECNSTNIYAKNLLSKNEPIEGTVVITDTQTNGKGQYGNKWHSTNYKNLTFSVIVKPIFLRPNEQFYISKAISLACVDFLNTFDNTEFQIKWPNDIYYKNKKIGGILIENIISSKQISYSIIGIGLNINQTEFKNIERAISLKQITNTDFSLEDVFQKLLKKIDAYYFQLRKRNFESLNKQYLENMFGFQIIRTFKNIETSEEFDAEIKGVNEIGQLHLYSNCQDLFFNNKEVIWKF